MHKTTVKGQNRPTFVGPAWSSCTPWPVILTVCGFLCTSTQRGNMRVHVEHSWQRGVLRNGAMYRLLTIIRPG